MRNNSTAPTTPKEATTNVQYYTNVHARKAAVTTPTATLAKHPPPYGAECKSHRNQGSIFQHFNDIHIMKPPLLKLLDQTEILHKETDFRKLQIYEAVSITCQRPSINIQQLSCTLHFAIHTSPGKRCPAYVTPPAGTRCPPARKPAPRPSH
ncbi:hypothetical protein Pcinc_034048 [Petrolisthes cinctipes]|uniref:Uncharacterized protein n=1 Tax=Petrolisthes cinctipes TaxID=88211 RepID=A0AAE1ER23_PETCI|nr:hypothetical protein Pcinc_034048 [Petrolisthes cinctipes]